MISKVVLRDMGCRTCAVGVLKVPPEQYAADPREPAFKICGTGFLVGPHIVLTNRHVLDGVARYLEEHGFPKSRRYVAFSRPHGPGMAQTFREFEKAGTVTRPRRIDLGLVTFRGDATDPLDAVSPVVLPETFSGEVGDPVALLGYAFGETLLKREMGTKELLYRMGPVLQQGYISAVAPYDHSAIVDRLLLDVRTAQGMSGSPVFDPATGNVLAVHSAGLESTVAFAVPLARPMIEEMLAAHSAGAIGTSGESTMSPVLRAPVDHAQATGGEPEVSGRGHR
jgi:S1-C subfamily serine protease